MKYVYTLIVFAALSLNVYPQTTLQDLGQLSNRTTTTPNVYNGSAVYDQYLYNAGDGKVYIYKMTDPKNPTYIKTIPSIITAQRVWAGEKYLFVYTGDKIKIYDLTDPETPNFKSDYSAGVDLHKVSARGKYMFVLYMSEYVTHKDGSFEIVDISNPLTPLLKSTYKPNNYEGRSFYFSSDTNRVFVAHYNSSLNQGIIRELDYSNPTSPTQVREKIISGAPVEMSISGSTLFVLKDGGWQGPSKLDAYQIDATSPITELASFQVSTGRAWDMHAYGNSITITLLETNGFKNYTWNATSKAFENSLSLNIPNASQLSWYMVSTQSSGNINNLRKTLGGYWIYFYFYVVEKSPSSAESETYGYYERLVEVKIWVEVPDVKVTLITSVNPAEAAADGCRVTPAGTNQYNKNTTVGLNATAGAGWVFDKWTGSITGSQNPQDLKMDNDKNVVGNFQPILNLSLSSPADSYLCPPGPNEELTIATANIFVDGVDWMLSGISFDIVNPFHLVYTEAWVECAGTNIPGTFSYSEQDTIGTSIHFSLSQQINEGTTLPVRLYLKFSFTSEAADKYIPKPLDEVRYFKVSTHVGNIICTPIPETARPGVKGPAYPPNIFYSNTQTVASIWNVSSIPNLPFTTIQNAINSPATSNGNIIQLCRGQYTENVKITKSLTIRSAENKSVTIVTAKDSSYNTFELNSDNTTIDGLTINGATMNAGISVSTDQAKNISIKNSIIRGNEYGIYNNAKNSNTNLENVEITNHKSIGLILRNDANSLTIKGTYNIVSRNKGGIRFIGNPNSKCTLDIKYTEVNDNRDFGIDILCGYPSGETILRNILISNNGNNPGNVADLGAGIELRNSALNAKDIQITSNGDIGLWIGSTLNTSSPIVYLENIKVINQKGLGIVIGGKATSLTIQGNDNTIKSNQGGIRFIGDPNFKDQVVMQNLEVSGNRDFGIDVICGVPIGEMTLHDVLIKNNGNNPGNEADLGPALEVSNSNIDAHNVEISDNGDYGIWVGRTTIYVSPFVYLENIKVLNQKEIGIIVSGEANGLKIRGNSNKIYGNKGGIRFLGSEDSRSLVDMYNLVVSNNNDFGIDVIFGTTLPRPQELIIQNSLIMNNGLNPLSAIDRGPGLEITRGRLNATKLNVLSNGSHGIKASDISYRQGTVSGNIGYGIVFTGSSEEIDIEQVAISGNTLGGIWFQNNQNQSGTNELHIKNLSGLHTSSVNSSNIPTIAGSEIVNNQGDGIRNEGNTKLSIINSNIFDNTGFGINNLKATTTIQAHGNWWGNDSGPSGSNISGNILTNNWLSTPVSLVVSSIKDTIYIPNNSLTDSTTIFINNYSRTSDNINVTISEQLNWITSQKNYSVTQDGSTGVSSIIKFNIPGSPQSSLNKVMITVSSITNPTQTAIDSFYVSLYSPTLSEIEVFPDSIKLCPGMVYNFKASGLDQKNSLLTITPGWSATGGAIDQNGLYTAGVIGGWYKVTAQNGEIKGEAVINIDLTVGVEHEQIPTEYSITQNYPNPFNPATKINYSVPQTSHVKITIFNILGQTVYELLNEEKIPGNYTLTWNAAHYASGFYICRIVTTNPTKNYVKSIKMILLK